MAGLALLHTKNVYTRYRESSKQKQKQPHTQCQRKKDAVQIIKGSLGRYPGGTTRRWSGPSSPPMLWVSSCVGCSWPRRRSQALPSRSSHSQGQIPVVWSLATKLPNPLIRMLLWICVLAPRCSLVAEGPQKIPPTPPPPKFTWKFLRKIPFGYLQKPF